MESFDYCCLGTDVLKLGDYLFWEVDWRLDVLPGYRGVGGCGDYCCGKDFVVGIRKRHTVQDYLQVSVV